MKPIVLAGRWVQLEPLAEAHREGLRAASDDERIWEHFLTDGRGSGFDPWFDEAARQRDVGRAVPFAVRALGGGQLVGCTAYLDYHPRHRRVEIGGTWYHPDVWGTRVNPECKLLLLTHAFDVLGVNRVQLITDVRNERSRRAIARLGAVQEGVLRAHAVSRNGRVRDSVVFGITTAEWPEVRAGLQGRLKASGAA